MKNQLLEQVLNIHSAHNIIEILDPYISNARKERIHSVINTRIDSIHLALESPCDINNALACVRTAEALGISTVHIITPEADASAAQGITRGAVFWVDVQFHADIAAFLSFAKKEKLTLAGAIMEAAEDLQKVSVENPLCLVIGNEQRGLSAEMLSACDITYVIPMCGMSESLNMSVSAAISLYDTCTRKRVLLTTQSDLSPAAKLRLKATYYLNSVNTRLAATALRRAG